MPKIKVERAKPHCDKLGKTAHLTLEYQYHDSGFRSLIKFDCDDAMSCGVAKQVSHGSGVFDWNSCPLYKKYESLNRQ